MLCCCERDEQTASRIMSDYNTDLGEWGVSSVPSLIAKIVGLYAFSDNFLEEFQKEKQSFDYYDFLGCIDGNVKSAPWGLNFWLHICAVIFQTVLVWSFIQREKRVNKIC